MTMRAILVSSRVALVDDADFARVTERRWYLDTKGYAFTPLGKRDGRQPAMRMHRFILDAAKGQTIDHINGDKLDNRRSNLRFCTQSQNQANSGPRKAGKRFKGAYWHPRDGHWESVIVVRGRRLWLGCFATEEEAARTYDAAALEHFGEFARLNLPAA